MDIRIIIGSKLALLPLHLDISLLEAILPDNERVFVMPWYSKHAGKYYHERLLDTNLDRRVETAAFAMSVDYRIGDVPVLVFPMVLDNVADCERLRAFIMQLTSLLVQEALVIRPTMLVYDSAKEKRATFDLGELPEHVTVLSIETFDFSDIMLTGHRERVAVNYFSQRYAAALCLEAAYNGLSLSTEDAITILVQHCLRLIRSGYWPSADATDKNITDICKIIFETQLQNVLSKNKD